MVTDDDGDGKAGEGEPPVGRNYDSDKETMADLEALGPTCLDMEQLSLVGSHTLHEKAYKLVTGVKKTYIIMHEAQCSKSSSCESAFEMNVIN